MTTFSREQREHKYTELEIPMSTKRRANNDNSTLDLFRTLSQEAGRKKLSQFVAEGITLVQRSLKDRLPIDTIVYTSALLSSSDGVILFEMLKQVGVPIYQVSSGLMGTLTATRPLPNIMAAVHISVNEEISEHTKTSSFLLAIDNVQNPDNLGMLLRTADAVGIDAVICGGVSDPTHKNCVRAARGAVGRIKILCTPDLVEWLGLLQQDGFTVVGATAHSQNSIFTTSFLLPIIVVVGNEQVGISENVRDVCNTLVRIPMSLGQDSLNVAVAAGILLYEVLRQKQSQRAL